MSRQFPGKRIVITGGASGLGLALAHRFAVDGWRIAIADYNMDRATDAREALQSGGATVIAINCDVCDDVSMKAVATQLQEQWNGVDVIVNNAGVGSAGTTIDTSMDDWQWTLDTNLLGVIRGCHLWTPLLVRQGAGHIVNIASFAGIANAPAMAAYNTAKAGVISLSETLRAEMQPHGVGVSVACPSFFRTNLLESFRTPDPRLHTFAEKMFQRASVNADDVADDIYQGVMKNRFMIITHADARWLYRLKRVAPGLFFRLLTRQAARMAEGQRTP